MIACFIKFQVLFYDSNVFYMKSVKTKLLLIPFVSVFFMAASVSFMIFLGVKTVDEVKSILMYRTVWIIINSSISVFVYYFFVSWFNNVLRWNRHWGWRLFADVILVIVLSIIGMLVVKHQFETGSFGMNGFVGDKDLFYVLPVMSNLMFLVLVELMHGIEERNKLELKILKVEKENEMANYQTLKAQIDSHFLFNNLSVLSSIIYEDVEKADTFIQKLSQVYRYVLSINKNDLVSLEEELLFIENYLELYKCRYESGFFYTMDIEKRRMRCLLPPLTLQILVENAIKHNVVSRKNPLNLKISADERTLVVENNLQIREVSHVSTHTGLNNLIEKYKLLGVAPPKIIKENKVFKVILPLIRNTDD